MDGRCGVCILEDMSTTTRTNRYDGTCQRCGANVPAETGVLYKRPPFRTSGWLVACGNDVECAARKADNDAAAKVAAAEAAVAAKAQREADLIKTVECAAAHRAENPSNVGNLSMAELNAEATMRARACAADFPKTIEFDQAEGWKVRYTRRMVKGGCKLTQSQVEPDGTVHLVNADVYDTEAEAMGRTIQRLAGSLTFRKDRDSVEFAAIKAFVEANR